MYIYEDPRTIINHTHTHTHSRERAHSVRCCTRTTNGMSH